MSEVATTSPEVPSVSADLAEEEQLTVYAEQALEQLLRTLLLQAAPSGTMTAALVTRSEPLSPAALSSLVKPVLVPLGLSIGLILARRAKRRYDTSEWHGLIEDTIAETVDRLAQTLANAAERNRNLDPYTRGATGPASADEWARRVATSAVTAVVENVKRKLATRLGFPYKRWLSREDNRVRDTHRILNGTTLEKNQKFTTQAGAELDHPGDQSAPIGEWINCRCRLLWLKRSQA